MTYTLRDNKDKFFFPAEYMKFEDKLKPKQKFSVRFLLNTGARHMEARHVKVADCDLENKRITLRVTKVKAKRKERVPKTRIIPISTQFSRELKKYIRKNKLKPEDYLGILSNSALNLAYKKAGIKSGVKDYHNISSHTFRKTLEVWLMALGVDHLPLTAHLGHDTKTAAQYYVSPDIFSWQDKQKIRDIIGDLYAR